MGDPWAYKHEILGQLLICCGRIEIVHGDEDQRGVAWRVVA